MEEECLKRRLKHVKDTGKSYVSPAPLAVDGCSPIIMAGDEDEFGIPERLLRLRNGQLQAGLGERLIEVETKRRLLGGFQCLMSLLLCGVPKF